MERCRRRRTHRSRTTRPGRASDEVRNELAHQNTRPRRSTAGATAGTSAANAPSRRRSSETEVMGRLRFRPPWYLRYPWLAFALLQLISFLLDERRPLGLVQAVVWTAMAPCGGSRWTPLWTTLGSEHRESRSGNASPGLTSVASRSTGQPVSPCSSCTTAGARSSDTYRTQPGMHFSCAGWRLATSTAVSRIAGDPRPFR